MEVVLWKYAESSPANVACVIGSSENFVIALFEVEAAGFYDMRTITAGP